MKYYLSGGMPEWLSRVANQHAIPRLASFAYPKEAEKLMAVADEDGVRLDVMLDSGAFTVWNSGGEVSMDDLMHHYEDLVERFGDRHNIVLISLDKIPGERGRIPSKEEVAKAVETSIANYHVMRARLPRPVLPVYHAGEEPWVLDEYTRCTDYVAFGISQTLSSKARLEAAMRMQRPGLKVHGLATTSTRMMRHVDWYSVDSSTWAMAAAMGNILWHTPWGIRQVSVSNESPRRYEAGRHVANMTERPQFEAAFKAAGFSLEELAESHDKRREWNVVALKGYDPAKNILPVEGFF